MMMMLQCLRPIDISGGIIFCLTNHSAIYKIINEYFGLDNQTNDNNESLTYMTLWEGLPKKWGTF